MSDFINAFDNIFSRSSPPAAAAPSTKADPGVQATFTAIQAAINPEVMASVNGVIQFDLKGKLLS